MTRKAVQATAAAAAMAAALSVGACAPDDAAPTTEPTSPTPSASATPSPSEVPSPSAIAEPERPAAMDGGAAEGAEAAAVYFLEMDAYIQSSGDTAEWDAMSLDTCDYCAARSEQAHEIQSAGYGWDSEPTRAEVLHTYAQDVTTGIWPIDVRITNSSTKVVDQTGATVFEAEAEVYDRHIEMAQRSGEWVVVGVAKIEEK